MVILQEIDSIELLFKSLIWVFPVELSILNLVDEESFNETSPNEFFILAILKLFKVVMYILPDSLFILNSPSSELIFATTVLPAVFSIDKLVMLSFSNLILPTLDVIFTFVKFKSLNFTLPTVLRNSSSEINFFGTLIIKFFLLIIKLKFSFRILSSCCLIVRVLSLSVILYCEI